MGIAKIRRKLYRSASILGDVQAIGSGSPRKIVKHEERKFLGRMMGRIMRKVAP